eukprot:scaffold1596_cov302-Pinguiococcus_pyrenoidosus.AAC.53
MDLGDLWQWESKKLACRVRQESHNPVLDELRLRLTELTGIDPETSEGWDTGASHAKAAGRPLAALLAEPCQVASLRQSHEVSPATRQEPPQAWRRDRAAKARQPHFFSKVRRTPVFFRRMTLLMTAGDVDGRRPPRWVRAMATPTRGTPRRSWPTHKSKRPAKSFESRRRRRSIRYELPRT